MNVTGNGGGQTRLYFNLASGANLAADISQLILVGFAGRDQRAIDLHIRELARSGIEAPAHTPCLYPVGTHLLTQGDRLSVYGKDTAPEVEFVLFTAGGRDYVTVGNDQSDLDAERLISPEKAKHLCPKAVARRAWELNECIDGWDRLRLRLRCNGSVMQDDSVDSLLRPESLFALVGDATDGKREGRMIFSGTIASPGAYPPGPYDVEIELADPAKAQSIRHSFRVDLLLPLPAPAPF